MDRKRQGAGARPPRRPVRPPEADRGPDGSPTPRPGPAFNAFLQRADDPARATAIARLQRDVGNAAVQRSMAPSTRTSLQRDIPTVHVNDLPMANEEQERIRLAARKDLPIWADTFANLWYTANNGALAATTEPADPDFESAQGVMAKAGFGIALAGNLVWAAACLMPLTATVAIAAMSFGGAAAGSGTISTLSPGTAVSSQPSFKAIASGGLAKARDKIAATSKDTVRDAANDAAVANESDVEQWKRRLWQKMFTTAYNEAEPIQAAAAAKLATAAPQFVQQWQTYKHSREVQAEASRLRDARIEAEGYPTSVWLRTMWEPSGPGGPKDQYRMQIFNEEWVKYAAATFRAQLNF